MLFISDRASAHNRQEADTGTLSGDEGHYIEIDDVPATPAHHGNTVTSTQQGARSAQASSNCPAEGLTTAGGYMVMNSPTTVTQLGARSTQASPDSRGKIKAPGPSSGSSKSGPVYSNSPSVGSVLSNTVTVPAYANTAAVTGPAYANTVTGPSYSEQVTRPAYMNVESGVQSNPPVPTTGVPTAMGNYDTLRVYGNNPDDNKPYTGLSFLCMTTVSK